MYLQTRIVSSLEKVFCSERLDDIHRFSEDDSKENTNNHRNKKFLQERYPTISLKQLPHASSPFPSPRAAIL